MSSEIDQTRYDQLMNSCPNCRSMHCFFGNTNGCMECGYEETREGVVINPGKKVEKK